MKKSFALLLALALMGNMVPAMAAEADEPVAAELPAWAYSEAADCYTLALFDDGIYIDHGNIITMEQLSSITKIVADKLALLNVPLDRNTRDTLLIDSTRGGVLNALYQEAAAYQFKGIKDASYRDEDGSYTVGYLRSLGVVCGDGSSLALDRPCTVLEASVFAKRLILALYDQQNAGSLGLLWKAEGNGSTLYLLGSIHTDRNDVYPFHKQLRDIITGAELAAFELDFNDEAGLAEFAAMQIYSDGTTLKDHIDPELYQEVVAALVPLGMTEEEVARYKPWALASSFLSLSMLDETSSGNAVAIDLYVSDKATNAGVPVTGVETYAFQGGIFNDLSAEYQEDYLALTLAMFQGEDMEGLDEESKAALALQDQAIEGWMTQWKSRDIEGFTKSYPKDEMMAEDSNEMDRKLFEGRDPNMVAWADSYLKREGSHTGLMTVGAGHMIGKTGIVQGLQDLGYTVEAVPLP